MQRFYMFHSFTRFHRNSIASAALFLAAKVEEQPRKLEHVIKIAHMCLHRGQPQLDVRSEAYQEQAQELVTNENILLQTLGFDVAIDHPHTHVVRCCQLVKAAKELAQTSYFMATNRYLFTLLKKKFNLLKLDLILQLTLDDNVLEIFAHHRGVRLHSLGLQVVQLQNPFVGSKERVVHLH